MPLLRGWFSGFIGGWGWLVLAAVATGVAIRLGGVFGEVVFSGGDRTKQPTLTARRLAESCERFVREVEEIAAEANGLQRPITVGAGEVVIREILIRWIGAQKKGPEANTWLMRNLTWRKIQEGLTSGMLDVGIADRFLEECEREDEARLKIGAECKTYPQVVDLAEATGSAVFVPEYWWGSHRKKWELRTHELPGLEKHQRTLWLGWNKKVAKRRPEVAALVKALQKRK